jgi:hypothetical protein
VERLSRAYRRFNAGKSRLRRVLLFTLPVHKIRIAWEPKLAAGDLGHGWSSRACGATGLDPP